MRLHRLTLASLVIASCSSDPTDIGRFAGDGATAQDGSDDLAAADLAGADLAGADLAGAPQDGGASVICGSHRCRVDQVCVSGECQFTCSGVAVPGMFASVKDAANSLPATGGTICIGDGATLDQSVICDRSLTIIGLSPTRNLSAFAVTVGMPTTRPSGLAVTLTLKGLGFRSGLLLQGNSTFADQIELVASTVGSSVDGEQGLMLVPLNAHITVDGSDLSNTFQAGNIAATVGGHLVTGANPRVTIQNCFFHDSGSGLLDNSADSGAVITVVNNTFFNDPFPVSANVTNTQDIAVNNLFAAASNNGINSVDLASAMWTVHNNSYFNVNDPKPSPGDVIADPLLDTETPPALGAGSPCRGAGDASLAPATDFFGRPRTRPVDIGARQEP